MYSLGWSRECHHRIAVRLSIGRMKKKPEEGERKCKITLKHNILCLFVCFVFTQLYNAINRENEKKKRKSAQLWTLNFNYYFVLSKKLQVDKILRKTNYC